MGMEMTLEEQVAKVEAKRYRVTRVCVCTPHERSNGWGCCCAWPIRVVEHSEGEFMLVPVSQAG